MKIQRQIKTKLFIFTGVAGVLSTAILSSIAAIKTLRKMGYEIDEKLDVKKYIKIGAKNYIPTGIAAGGTILSIVALDITHENSRKMLAGAYATLGMLHSRYRQQIEEAYGKETETDIFETVQNDGDYSSSEYQYEFLIYEPYSNQFFRKTIAGLLEAEYKLNRLFVLREYVTMNDFLEILGQEKQEGGDEIGWSIWAGYETYGYSWIDFVHELKVISDPDDPEAMEYYEIQYPFEPTGDFLD